MLQGDLERINECKIWSYQWFEPFSLMQKLLENRVCFKPLRKASILLSSYPMTHCLNARVTIEVKNNNNKPVRVNDIKRCVVAFSSILH